MGTGVQKLSGVVVALVLAAALVAACDTSTPAARAVGPSTVPPTTSPPPSSTAPAVPVGTAQRPGDVFDLSRWHLTLPTGEGDDPEVVRQPELDTYSGAHFHLDDSATGVVFTTNAGGVTTSGSDYPRTELREMDGTERAAWSSRSGVHTMRLRAAITALPPVKPEVVTAQIHDGDDDVLEIRLEDRHLIAQYEDGDRDLTLDPDYRLGTPFDLEIVAAAGGIEVRYDGAVAARIPQVGSGWFFKAGSYLQSNPERGDAADAVGTVVIYALDVEHTP
jgi:alginate lyase